MSTRGCVGATVVVLATVAPLLAATPSFQTIGMHEVTGISSDGSVVIGHDKWLVYPPGPGGTLPWYEYEGLRWCNGVMTSLGGTPSDFPDEEGHSVNPLGVSGDGSVIVGQSDGEAFRWENGVMTTLGAVSGYRSTSAVSVSGDGSVIPMNCDLVSGVGTGIVCWRDGATTLVASGGGLGQLAWATGISGDGNTIVGFDNAVCYWRNGVKSPLGSAVTSLALGISDDGSVIIGGSESTEAWRWENSAVTGLGHIAAGHVGGIARDVSADGSVIVGEDYLSSSSSRAFIWSAETGMQNLNDVLVNEYGFDLMGWTLTSVMGISDDGLTLAGNAYKTLDGKPGGTALTGWVAHIPEPTTMLLLASGAGLLCGLRRPHR